MGRRDENKDKNKWELEGGRFAERVEPAGGRGGAAMVAAVVVVVERTGPGSEKEIKRGRI